jgi:hypothetical protein
MISRLDHAGRIQEAVAEQALPTSDSVATVAGLDPVTR